VNVGWSRKAVSG